MRNSTPVLTLFVALLCVLTTAQSQENPGLFNDSFTAKSELNVTVESFSINPNPVSDKTTFLYSDNHQNKNITVLIYNVLGQEVGKLKLLSNQPYIFERDRLKSGIYMVQVTDESKILAATKMVIR